MTPKTKCIVNAPMEIVRNALRLAAAQRKRAVTTATNVYGADHIITQTFRQEEETLNHATNTLERA